MALGLASEAGEVAGKYKKVLRGDKELDTVAMAQEVADCLWYIDRLAVHLGFSMEELMQMNYDKLMSRKERGTIKGDGDVR